jgi:hypothetical protein
MRRPGELTEEVPAFALGVAQTAQEVGKEDEAQAGVDDEDDVSDRRVGEQQRKRNIDDRDDGERANEQLVTVHLLFFSLGYRH